MSPPPCPRCGAVFASPSARGGHKSTCNPERDRRIAEEYVRGAGVLVLARRYGLSPEGTRRAIKRAGVKLRPPGGRHPVRSAPSEPVVYASEAFPGRCGTCLQRIDGAHSCEPVRVMSESGAR